MLVESSIGTIINVLDWYVGGFICKQDAKNFQIELDYEWNLIWPTESGVLQPPLRIEDSDHFVVRAEIISEIEKFHEYERRRLEDRLVRFIPPYQIYQIVNYLEESGSRMLHMYNLLNKGA